MTARRWLLLAIVLLTGVQCGIWFVAASVGWTFRDLLVDPSSGEAANRTRLAIVMFAGLAINAIAVIAFLLRRHGFGWLILVVVQTGDLIFAIVAAITINTWWLLSAVAALTISLLFLLRRLGFQQTAASVSLPPGPAATRK